MSAPEKSVKKESKWAITAGLIFGLTMVCVVALYLGELIHSGPRGGPEGRTEALLMQLGTVFVEYQTDYGALPPSSENYQLAKTLSGDNPRKKAYFLPQPNQINANREYIDAWGTPLRFSFKSNGDSMDVLIISAGPDKIFGTADDIKNQ